MMGQASSTGEVGSERRIVLPNYWQQLSLVAGRLLFTGTGGPRSAGRTNNVQSSVQPSAILNRLPMLAVRGWLDSMRLPKAVPVNKALNSTARAVADCSGMA